jgi:hypothetical protein
VHECGPPWNALNWQVEKRISHIPVHCLSAASFTMANLVGLNGSDNCWYADVSMTAIPGDICSIVFVGCRCFFFDDDVLFFFFITGVLSYFP